MKKIENIYYSDNYQLDIYLPDNKMPVKTIIYFHGGGITCGDKYDENIESFARSFTNVNIAFVSVNYPLYPNTKFPLFLKECAKSISYIINHLKEYDLSKNIYVSGSSAGGYITMMLCMNKQYLLDEKVPYESIKGWISDDGQMTDHFNVQLYESNMDPWIQRISEKSPIYYIDNNIKCSPILILYYDNDMPMRKEQNLLFAATLRHFQEDVDITLHELHGTHCEGTSIKDNDGEFRFVKEILNWLNR